MAQLWKNARYRLEWLALQTAAALVPLLSRKTCFHFGGILGWLAAILDRPGRRVTLSNLEAAFGDELPAARKAAIVRGSYQQFARTMLDLLWAPRLTAENFRKWIEVVDMDEVLAEVGPSFIIATPHFGNFEWAAQATGLSGVRLLILTQEFKNPRLDAIFEELRGNAGHEMAGRQGAMIKMFKALKRKRPVGILSDLTLKPTDPSVVIDCFGLKTCVTFAHAWLHRRTGAPIVPLYCEQLPGGRCRLILQRKLEIPMGATEAEITQACWNRFEPLIRQNPAGWLWMYKHWRYKPAPADRPYPFYSNPWDKFDALIAKSAESAELEATHLKK